MRERMYRGKSIVMILLTAILLIGMANLNTVSGEETISYTDPTGDVENDGVSSDGEASADIVSLSMDYSSDPILIEMVVEGTIVYEGGDIYYDYYIYIDHTGSGDEETEIEISNLYGMLFSSDYGSDQTITSEVSGNGTSTLGLEIPVSWFGSAPGYEDVYASSDITSSNFMYTASDYINEDFAGGGGGGDDDTPPDLYLPTEEDPADATPTDPSISVSIDNFNTEFTMGSSEYELIQEASGAGEASIYKCAYALVYYPEDGSSTLTSWELGPMDVSHTYGDMSYEERFMGKTSEDSWDTWEWYFKSTGPSDTSEIQKYTDESGYWNTIDKVVFYVRAFDDEGNWNQDSLDVTDEMMPDSEDGDDTGDDTGDDDKGDDEESDDSPGAGLTLISFGAIISVVIASLILGRKRS